MTNPSSPGSRRHRARRRASAENRGRALHRRAPSTTEKTTHTLRARRPPPAGLAAGIQLRSTSSSSAARWVNSVCERTASSAAIAWAQTPLAPQVQTGRSASGPVPPPHSTRAITGVAKRGSRTSASTRGSSTTRSETRPPSTRASAVATRSRANHEATAAGRRARHAANGLPTGAYPYRLRC